MEHAPGGGKRITIIDLERFPMHLIRGQEVVERGHTLPEKLIYNSETDKPRTGHFQRCKEGPAAVHKVESYSWSISTVEASD